MNHTELKMKEISEAKQKLKEMKELEKQEISETKRKYKELKGKEKEKIKKAAKGSDQTDKIVICKECGKEFRIGAGESEKKHRFCPICMKKREEKRKSTLKNVGKGVGAAAGIALMIVTGGKLGKKG